MAELSGKRRGTVGELIITKKLIELGFDVYDNIVDDRGIDLIIRNDSKGKIFHKDLQVKHSKYYPKHNYYWFGLSKATYKPYNRLFLAFVIDEHKMFIIPSARLNEFLKKVWTDKKGNWKIVIQQKDNWELMCKSGKKNINIEIYLNNFSQLR